MIFTIPIYIYVESENPESAYKYVYDTMNNCCLDWESDDVMTDIQGNEFAVQKAFDAMSESDKEKGNK